MNNGQRQGPSFSTCSAAIRQAKNTYVELSPWAYRFAWLGILVLHVVCVGYLTLVAWVYWRLPVSYPELGIDSYSIYLSSTSFRLLSFVHWIFVGAHGLLVVLMLAGSTVHRRLVFFPNRNQIQRESARGDRGSWLRLQSIKDSLFGRFGLFGVESRYFDAMILFRVVTQTILQTYKAYRMSLYMPRIWVNRCFVALLVLNCWITPLLSIVFRRRPMVRRLLQLLCGTIVDLVSSVGIPLILLPTYAKDFDPENPGGFDLSLWQEDEWYVRTHSELQLLVLSSWMDLFSRVVFYIGVIGNTTNIKDLLRPKTKQAVPEYVRPAFTAPTEAVPLTQKSVHSAAESTPQLSVPQLVVIYSFASFKHRYSSRIRRLVHIAHLAFIIWGLSIMIFHLLAEQQVLVTHCPTQVRPWAASKPGCALLVMDCHADSVPGSAEDIIPRWDHTDESTVTRVLIRHCPQLQMPSIITSFRQLNAIKIYNSTVVEWDNNAALTNQHHPTLFRLLVIRSNFTDGQLPVGLLATNFPQQLYDIEFQITNLRTLPDDLDTRWLQGSALLFENCQFDYFPSVLHRIATPILSIAFNRIETVPFEVFLAVGAMNLNLAGNPISTLSEPSQGIIPVSSSSVISLNLARTSISYLPRWMDSMFNHPTLTISIFLWDSPFCIHCNEIASGNRSHFPELDFMPLDQLSNIMSMTASQLVKLDGKLSCQVTSLLYYPYGQEDSLNSALQES